MEGILHDKIQKLAKEAQELSNMKQSIQKQVKDIDTRLSHIAGAIIELQKLQNDIGETDDSNTSETNQSEFSGCFEQAEQESDSTQNSV